jgi:hypothetical protein
MSLHFTWCHLGFDAGHDPPNIFPASFVHTVDVTPGTASFTLNDGCKQRFANLCSERILSCNEPFHNDLFVQDVFDYAERPYQMVLVLVVAPLVVNNKVLFDSSGEFAEISWLGGNLTLLCNWLSVFTEKSFPCCFVLLYCSSSRFTSAICCLKLQLV